MAASMPELLGRFERGFSKLLTQPRRWFVLVGDRLVVAVTLTIVFAFATVALSTSSIVHATDSTEMIYLFQALVAGNVTLLTIVLSVNQLVLSREMNTPGELRKQIENVIAYRDNVEATTHQTAVPVTPSEFLPVLLDGTRESTQQLGGLVAELDPSRHAAEVESLVSDLTRHLDSIRVKLERSQGGIFSTLASMLETNFSCQLHTAYRIRKQYTDELPEPAHELLDEMIEGLEQIDIARQYFRSIYIQSELARLSRILLYVGTPAVASALLLLYVATSSSGSAHAVDYLRVAAPVVLVLGFAPLAVLFSFVLRIAAVAQRTVAITPFTTPEQEEGFDY